MLKVNVRGENIEVTSAIRDYYRKESFQIRKIFGSKYQCNGAC